MEILTASTDNQTQFGGKMNGFLTPGKTLEKHPWQVRYPHLIKTLHKNLISALGGCSQKKTTSTFSINSFWRDILTSA
jgi:hypothetical protein